MYSFLARQLDLQRVRLEVMRMWLNHSGLDQSVSCCMRQLRGWFRCDDSEKRLCVRKTTMAVPKKRVSIDAAIASVISVPERTFSLKEE